MGSSLSWASLPAGILSLFDPQLGAGTQAVVRAASGLLLVGMLLLAAPHFRRFFLSERWGGYIAASPGVDRIHNPVVAPALFALWLLAGALLALDVWSAAAAAVSLVCARHCFVAMRWRALHRGMGAPGFLAYWLAAAVCLLEVARWHAPEIRPLVLLVLQTDFAAIILSAGLYKLVAGYARQQGMELGLVNPEWGYWWRAYASVPPGHRGFRLLNHLAWTTEIAAAFLMLLPPTRPLGGLLLILSFAFVATQIRLGLLCEMVMVCGLLYMPAGSLVDGWLAAAAPAAAAPLSPAGAGLIGPLLAAGLWGYLALLPLVHGGLWLNLLGRRRLPGPLQGALEAYTNAFGILIWRVFSVDIVNFFIRIYQEPRGGGARRMLTEYGWRGGLRFSHVGESITLTCVFTTLKYYPGDRALFRERLLRYARTLPCPPEAVLVFEYVSIGKEISRFTFAPAAEFVVNVPTGSVTERILDERAPIRAAHPASPLQAGVRPGSYAPSAP